VVGRLHRVIEGELLAVSADTLYLAETDWDQLAPGRPAAARPLTFRFVPIARAEIRWAIVRGYRGDAATAPLSAVIVFSAFSHGWWGLLTFPALFGIHSQVVRTEGSRHAAQYRAPRSSSDSVFDEGSGVEEAQEQWFALRQWARFPQGLPAGLDRSAVRPYLPRVPFGALPPNERLPRRGSPAGWIE
jgi:hypothetical protein